MQLVLATTNPHKLREIREILGPLGVLLRGLHETGREVAEPVESGSTFEANARLKAMTYARALGQTCLADDSGLEVDALGGAPGVHSARYAGLGATREERDQANREKLVTELRKLGQVTRTARLVCTLCVAEATGRVLFEARGTLEGLIKDEPHGGNGFGYDAHLFLPDVRRTAAELSPEELNARSHRGAAARALERWLRTCVSVPPAKD
jgi:XTP/dITP diphosphohydrolase